MLLSDRIVSLAVAVAGFSRVAVDIGLSRQSVKGVPAAG